MQDKLATAISIAVDAHKGQFDKAGKPYILHPLYLMSQMMYDTELAIIAVLHDVVEDSDITLNFLKVFSVRVIDALDLLTHNPKDDYLKVYIPKIAQNYDTIRVKMKDLEHNSDITRLKGVRPKDLVRIEKYHQAFLLLTKAKERFV